MNELTKIVLDFLRKQAGMVFILILACGGLAWLVLQQKHELTNELINNRSEYRENLLRVSERLDRCEEARTRLVVEVEVLKVQAESLKLQVEALRARLR